MSREGDLGEKMGVAGVAEGGGDVEDEDTGGGGEDTEVTGDMINYSKTQFNTNFLKFVDVDN